MVDWVQHVQCIHAHGATPGHTASCGGAQSGQLLGYSMEGSDKDLGLGMDVFMVYLMIKLYHEILRIPLSLEPIGMNVFLQA